MSVAKKYNFANVKIKDNLAKQIDEFIESETAKRDGFRSRADFVTKAALKLLEEYRPRFEHLNMVDDNVKVVDFAMNCIATIYFKNGGTVYCDVCEGDACEHIDYALDQPDVKKALEHSDWVRRPIPEDEIHDITE